MSIERPYRHLCPDADFRDALSDDDFWHHVFSHLYGPMPEFTGFEPADDEPAEVAGMLPCPLCGESGACAYDAEGLPLIHALEMGE